VGAFALSFDDGPDPVWTPPLLAVLARREAIATFFVDSSRALSHPGDLEAIVAAGHEVGFHCHRHLRHSDLNESEVAADAASGLDALDSLGVRPEIWRTPWGVETHTTRRLAAEHGLELRRWNRDSHDWRGESCERMLAGIEAEGGLRDGAIVLMHDAIGPGALRDGCAETVRLAAALLDRAMAAGLAPAPVSAIPAPGES
jgi:peptidoglycan/xylan/chitin deacetylase (PgdA/CDA1 family)